MTDVPTNRRAQLFALLTAHALTDDQAREHPHDLIRAQAAMTPHNARMADGWLVNRLVVRHRKLGWSGTPPCYAALLRRPARTASSRPRPRSGSWCRHERGSRRRADRVLRRALGRLGRRRAPGRRTRRLRRDRDRARLPPRDRRAVGPGNLRLDPRGIQILATGPLAAGANVQELVDDAFDYADLPGIVQDHQLNRL